jgi:hypothetical protein
MAERFPDPKLNCTQEALKLSTLEADLRARGNTNRARHWAQQTSRGYLFLDRDSIKVVEKNQRDQAEAKLRYQMAKERVEAAEQQKEREAGKPPKMQNKINFRPDDYQRPISLKPMMRQIITDIRTNLHQLVKRDA